MRSFSPFKVGMESIAFQSNPALRKELLATTQQIFALPKKDISADHELFGVLAATIKHRTGINASIVVGTVGPAVEIPSVDRNNPLLVPMQRAFSTSSDGMRLIAQSEDLVRGGVDARTGMVTGVFTELPIKFYFPVSMFAGKLTPEEAVGVMLHEIGHPYTYFEYITRAATSNAVLSGLSKALDGADSVQSREAILISAKKALRLSDLDEKELAKSSNKKVIEVVVITSVIRQTRSELGSNIYDMTTWEALADQYATRMGAGRDLTTGLAKLYRGGFNISFRSLPTYLAMEAFKLIAIVNPAIFLFLLLLDSPSELYDTPGDRFKRIRNQVVENLREPELSKDDIARLNEDLRVLDDMIKSVNDRRQLIGLIWDTVSPQSRKDRNQRLLQQNLEELAANDLFIAAVNLKQLA